jgi:DNA-directed RNA polymerase specialized sigma24 family protein
VLFSALPAHIVENIAPVLMDDEIERKELMNKISGVLDDLPHDYQVVLRLKYVEGEKVKTISEKLKLPFKATESLIFRARKAFVKLFNTTT